MLPKLTIHQCDRQSIAALFLAFLLCLPAPQPLTADTQLAPSSSTDAFTMISRGAAGIPGAGSLDEISHGEAPLSVILIKDAHDNLDAQKSIAEMIAHFVDEGGVRRVFEEGYEGRVPTEAYFGFITSPEVRQKTAYFFMDHLRLGGAEYAHALNPQKFELTGIENFQSYILNLEAYRKAALAEKELESGLSIIRRRLEVPAFTRFSAELTAFYKLKQDYQLERIDFADYAFRLTALRDLPEQDYPQLTALAALRRCGAACTDPEIDFKTLQQEINRCETALLSFFAENETQQQLWNWLQGLSLLERMGQFSADRDTFEQARILLKSFNAESLARFLAGEQDQISVIPRAWETQIQHMLDFYAAAVNRESDWEFNLRGMVQSREPETVIVVAGGFHTQALQDYFNEKSISLAVISPAIKNFDERHTRYYRQLMSQGQLDFESAAGVTAARPASLYAAVRAGILNPESIAARLESLADFSARYEGDPSQQAFRSGMEAVWAEGSQSSRQELRSAEDYPGFTVREKTVSLLRMILRQKKSLPVDGFFEDVDFQTAESVLFTMKGLRQYLESLENLEAAALDFLRKGKPESSDEKRFKTALSEAVHQNFTAILAENPRAYQDKHPMQLLRRAATDVLLELDPPVRLQSDFPAGVQKSRWTGTFRSEVRDSTALRDYFITPFDRNERRDVLIADAFSKMTPLYQSADGRKIYEISTYPLEGESLESFARSIVLLYQKVFMRPGEGDVAQLTRYWEKLISDSTRTVFAAADSENRFQGFLISGNVRQGRKITLERIASESQGEGYGTLMMDVFGQLLNRYESSQLKIVSAEAAVPFYEKYFGRRVPGVKISGNRYRLSRKDLQTWASNGAKSAPVDFDGGQLQKHHLASGVDGLGELFAESLSQTPPAMNFSAVTPVQPGDFKTTLSIDRTPEKEDRSEMRSADRSSGRELTKAFIRLTDTVKTAGEPDKLGYFERLLLQDPFIRLDLKDPLTITPGDIIHVPDRAIGIDLLPSLWQFVKMDGDSMVFRPLSRSSGASPLVLLRSQYENGIQRGGVTIVKAVRDDFTKILQGRAFATAAAWLDPELPNIVFLTAPERANTDPYDVAVNWAGWTPRQAGDDANIAVVSAKPENIRVEKDRVYVRNARMIYRIGDIPVTAKFQESFEVHYLYDNALHSLPPGFVQALRRSNIPKLLNTEMRNLQSSKITQLKIAAEIGLTAKRHLAAIPYAKGGQKLTKIRELLLKLKQEQNIRKIFVQPHNMANSNNSAAFYLDTEVGMAKAMNAIKTLTGVNESTQILVQDFAAAPDWGGRFDGYNADLRVVLTPNPDPSQTDTWLVGPIKLALSREVEREIPVYAANPLRLTGEKFDGVAIDTEARFPLEIFLQNETELTPVEKQKLYRKIVDRAIQYAASLKKYRAEFDVIAVDLFIVRERDAENVPEVIFNEAATLVAAEANWNQLAAEGVVQRGTFRQFLRKRALERARHYREGLNQELEFELDAANENTIGSFETDEPRQELRSADELNGVAAVLIERSVDSPRPPAGVVLSREELENADHPAQLYDELAVLLSQHPDFRVYVSEVGREGLDGIANLRFRELLSAFRSRIRILHGHGDLSSRLSVRLISGKFQIQQEGLPLLQYNGYGTLEAFLRILEARGGAEALRESIPGYAYVDSRGIWHVEEPFTEAVSRMLRAHYAVGSSA